MERRDAVAIVVIAVPGAILELDRHAEMPEEANLIFVALDRERRVERVARLAFAIRRKHIHGAGEEAVVELIRIQADGIASDARIVNEVGIGRSL